MTQSLSCLPKIVLLACAMGVGLIASNPKQACAEETCDTYGTTVEFYGSPVEAARRALQEEKLVFVLHVSGHFEVSEFT